MKKIFLNTCEKILPKFLTNVNPLDNSFIRPRRGIRVSNGFAFCVFCDIFDINLVVESGIFNGQSTFMFANYFKDSEVLIRSIDRNEISEFAKEKLEPWIQADYLRIYTANSREKIPELIREHRDKNIAVLIDGPKDIKAFKLALRCLKKKNVKFVAIDDIRDFENTNDLTTRLQKIGDKFTTFFTADLDFVKRYSFLDKSSHDGYYYPVEKNFRLAFGFIIKRD